MTKKPKMRLVVQEGGRKELERQLRRALIEFRTEDAHALIVRIAHRASLRVIKEEMTSSDEPHGGDKAPKD